VKHVTVFTTKVTRLPLVRHLAYGQWPSVSECCEGGGHDTTLFSYAWLTAHLELCRSVWSVNAGRAFCLRRRHTTTGTYRRTMGHFSEALRRKLNVISSYL